MKRLTNRGIVLVGLIVSAWADTGEKERERITASTDVVKDIFNAPDKGVPLSVLDGTKCVIVIPGLKKAAFIIGGVYWGGGKKSPTGGDRKGPGRAPVILASRGRDTSLQRGA